MNIGPGDPKRNGPNARLRPIGRLALGIVLLICCQSVVFGDTITVFDNGGGAQNLLLESVGAIAAERLSLTPQGDVHFR